MMTVYGPFLMLALVLKGGGQAAQATANRTADQNQKKGENLRWLLERGGSEPRFRHHAVSWMQEAVYRWDGLP